MALRLPNRDPVTLEELCDTIDSATDVEACGNAVLYMASVVHCAAVKEYLGRRPRTVETIAKFLVPPTLRSIRWEVLMILGEVCRRETAKDAMYLSATEQNNALAERQSLSLALLPWYHLTLRDVQTSETGSDTALIAGDLLAALPPHAPTREESLAKWTEEARDRCCDLMFLDHRYSQFEYAPFVARASRKTCAACGKTEAAGTQPTYGRCAQCKAVFYCTPECQRQHWKSSHKAPCVALKNGLADGFRRVDGSAEAFAALFFENRAFTYLRRPEQFRGVSFDDFFMKYTSSTV